MFIAVFIFYLCFLKQSDCYSLIVICCCCSLLLLLLFIVVVVVVCCLLLLLFIVAREDKVEEVTAYINESSVIIGNYMYNTSTYNNVFLSSFPVTSTSTPLPEFGTFHYSKL